MIGDVECEILVDDGHKHEKQGQTIVHSKNGEMTAGLTTESLERGREEPEQTKVRREIIKKKTG